MDKKRFTWLDALICGVLILALAVVGVWYFTKDGSGAEVKEYEVTLRFPRATYEEFDYYQVGDRLYFQGRTAELGTITSLKEIDLVYEEYLEKEARYVKAVHPEKKAVEMKVRVQGAVVEGSFTVNGKPVMIGQEFYPQSDTTRSVFTVWDIEEVAA